MTVARLYRLAAAEGREAALADVLARLVPVFAALPGCHGVVLLAERPPEAGFLLIHRWDSAAAHSAALPGLPRDLLIEMMACLPGAPEGRYLDEVARGCAIWEGADGA